ncbi:winged helix-turn-helix domain-containing protein [Halovivax gelatinilyticus]|uniref:winged helix-turn-helix domain-containing protein n=1 Tax=Halovivax gelatinilyticus TaxID=2961597 RepID=UPI0020CA4262|nr:winged helix-turn-helix domain-containing protein [Halovivax gelatinilyticus]
MSERTTHPHSSAASSDVLFRDAYPSGWRALTKNDSVCAMIDAMLDLPPRREFNQTELADLANVSRQSVNRHIDLLAELGIVERVDGSSPQRFRFDTDNAVSEALIRLDGAIRAAGADASN